MKIDLKTLKIGLCFQILLIFVFPGISSGQNYQCVRSNDRKFFSGQYEYLGLRVDSVVVNGTDSLFYNHKTQRDTSVFGCQYLFGPSWLGSPFIVRNNGFNYAVTQSLDTLSIKVNAMLNETWLFVNYPAQGYVMATVSAIDTITINGLVDSIKTIRFDSYDTLGNPSTSLGSTFNYLELKLSRDNGFYEIIDFYDLMNSSGWPLGGNFIWQPLRIPTRKEIFDLYPGDQLHYKIHQYDMFCYQMYPDNEERRYVTQRVDDTLNHTVALTYRIQHIVNATTTPFIYTDSTTEMYDRLNDPVCIQYPYEPIVNVDSTGYSDFHFYSYRHFLCDSDEFVINHNGLSVSLQPGNQLCGVYGGDIYDTGYSAGVGYSYINHRGECGVGGISGTENVLVYYLKNGISCGYPVTTGMEELQNNYSFSIYPQPANNEIFLSGKNFPGNSFYSLFDFTGRLVISGNLGNDSKIKLPESCKNGIYLLRIQDGDSVFSRYITITR